MSVFVINDKLALAAYLLNVYLYIGCVMNEWRLLYNLKNVFFYFIQLFWKYNIYHFSFILMSYFHIRSMFISLYSTKALYKKNWFGFINIPSLQSLPVHPRLQIKHVPFSMLHLLFLQLTGQSMLQFLP